MPSDRREWTDDDVETLIRTLKAERPDFWAAYIEGETKYKAINDEVGQWIIVTENRLFPNQIPRDLTALLSRFRDIARRQLGLEE